VRKDSSPAEPGSKRKMYPRVGRSAGELPGHLRWQTECYESQT